jgi:hypothetical protein
MLLSYLHELMCSNAGKAPCVGSSDNRYDNHTTGATARTHLLLECCSDTFVHLVFSDLKQKLKPDEPTNIFTSHSQ